MIRLDAEAVDSLLVEAMHGNLHLHVVDGGHDRESAYDAFEAALDLPDWFGRNLDALYDCLLDIVDRHDGPWTLLWLPAAGSEAADDAGLLGVLADLEMESEGLTVAVG